MEALNKKERSDAFASFLVFFLISVSLLLLAVFFAYRVPDKENDLLRKKLKKYERDFSFMNSYSQELDETKVLLDSMSFAGIGATSFKSRIDYKIGNLEKRLLTDSLMDKKLYQTINQTLRSNLAATSIATNSTSTEELVNKLQQQLTSAQTELNMYRQQATQNYPR